EVDVGAGGAGGEGEGGHVGSGDAVEVVGRREPRGRRHPHGVVAAVQVAEGVVAVAAGGGGGHDVVGGVEQLDGDAVDAALAEVLGAVAVGVEPDAVAHRGGALVAEVDVGPALPRIQGEGRGVGRSHAVGVEGRSHAGWQRGGDDP